MGRHDSDKLMTWIIIFLLLCGVLLPLAFVLRQCTSAGKIEFNHVLLFSIGYVVYWITPIAVGESRLFTASSGMTLWYGLFDRIPETTLVLYLLMAVSLYLAFCAGVLLCRRILPGNETAIRGFFFDRRLLNIFLLLGTAAAGAYVVLLRDSFFRGYTLNSVISNFDSHGPLIAISIFLLSLAILYSLKRQEKEPDISFRQAVSHHFFVIYFVFALLVLSLGGRLYFLSSILMLLVYRSVYFQKITYRSFALFVLTVMILAGIIGRLRLGAEVSVTESVFNLAAEPLFNSFSLLQFLADGRFELINVPVFLLGDFVNLIPTALFPGKAALLLNPDDFGYHVFSPVGSLSAFFSFMINFGFLGTALFFFLLGYFLQLLRARGRSLLSKTIYIMTSGWLMTTFFRDPFSTSLVKSIFQYSILFPAIVVFLAGLITFWLVEAPRRAVGTGIEEATERA